MYIRWTSHYTLSKYDKETNHWEHTNLPEKIVGKTCTYSDIGEEERELAGDDSDAGVLLAAYKNFREVRNSVFTTEGAALSWEDCVFEMMNFSQGDGGEWIPISPVYMIDLFLGWT